MQEEVACIAYHFHWPLDQILAFDHVSRRQWLQSIQTLQSKGTDRF
ncbi:MAG: DUF6760 family protein [Cyanobacteria bacterium P01_A01_bin.15]